MVEAFRHRSRSGGAPARASSRPFGPRRRGRLRSPWHVRRSPPAAQKPVPGRVFPDGGVLAPHGGGPGIPGLPGGGWITGRVIPHVRHGFPHLRQSTRDPQVRGAFHPEYRKSLLFGNAVEEMEHNGIQATGMSASTPTGGEPPSVPPKAPLDTLPGRLLSGNGSESDPSTWRLWRFHQRTDRVEDHPELGVVFPFESVYLAGQFLVG